MAHLVKRRRGKYVYASIEESYRDGKKVKKRILKWLGRITDTIIYNLKSEPGAAAYAAWEQEQLERVRQEEKAYQEALQRLPEGLHVGPTDPVAPDVPSEPQAEQAPASSDSPSSDAAPSEPASEPSSEKS